MKSRETTLTQQIIWLKQHIVNMEKLNYQEFNPVRLNTMKSILGTLDSVSDLVIKNRDLEKKVAACAMCRIRMDLENNKEVY